MKLSSYRAIYRFSRRLAALAQAKCGGFTANRILCFLSGEPSRTRTCDPLVKSQLLYQLSYGPTKKTVKGILTDAKVQRPMSIVQRR